MTDNQELALFGGAPTLAPPLERFRSMGEAERVAVDAVMRDDLLSGFYGSPGDEFFGGPRIRALESAWAKKFDVPHAISVNSATSGLFAAMGAIGLSPGDEVIVPPTTMSATVMAPLVYGGIPVFADIEDDYFCIDPEAVRAAITPRTRAILAVNLFGHPAELKTLRAIADAAGIYLVEDSAQAPFAMEAGQRAGTIGHIGVYSLNYHKHLHTGEGGICVTTDDKLARRLQLIRNHGENSTDWLGEADLTNMIGFNYRMTELSAAVGLVQLGQIEALVGRCQDAVPRLSAGIADLEGLIVPPVRTECSHNYYCWTLRCKPEELGISRQTFCDALAAEGIETGAGYVPPLYMLPAFQQRRALGRDGFPFTLSERTYDKGLCPVAERLHEEEIFVFEPCQWDLGGDAVDRIIAAFRKVHGARDRLAEHEARNHNSA